MLWVGFSTAVTLVELWVMWFILYEWGGVEKYGGYIIYESGMVVSFKFIGHRGILEKKYYGKVTLVSKINSCDKRWE